MRSVLRAVFVALLLDLVAWPAGTLAAATRQADADTEEAEAIRCWRRVGRNTVYVGERFTLTLTCSVIEIDTARTVPDQAGLEPETLGVAPFEVLEGQHYADLRRGPRRFFQYHYVLRLLGEEFFGTDVEIPPLEITYRIERTLEGGSALQGRELTYILPAESVSVLSLVPAEMTDIREPPGDTFGDAEARVFRANVATLAAAVFGMVALTFVLVAALGVRREWRGAVPRVEKRLPHWAIVRRALGELTRVQRVSQDEGWTRELAGKALAVFRVAGAVAFSQPIVQTVVGPDVGDRDGQLSLRHGFWRRKKTLLSSALTPTLITRQVEQVRSERPAGPPPPGSVSGLEDIRTALVTFTTARYSQTADVDTDALTSELDKGIALLRRLWFRTLPPVRHAERLAGSVRGWLRGYGPAH